MLSSDVNQNNNLIEAFNNGISEIKSEIQGLKFEIQGLKSEIQEIKADIRDIKAEIKILDRNVAVNSAKIEMLNHTFYWGFGIMAVIVALVAVLVPYLMRGKSESTEPQLTEAKVQSMIDAAVSRALVVN